MSAGRLSSKFCFRCLTFASLADPRAVPATITSKIAHPTIVLFHWALGVQTCACLVLAACDDLDCSLLLGVHLGP